MPKSNSECKDGSFSMGNNPCTRMLRGNPDTSITIRGGKKKKVIFFPSIKINLSYFFKCLSGIFLMYTHPQASCLETCPVKEDLAAYRHGAAAILPVATGEMQNWVIFTEVQACKFPTSVRR